MKLTRREFLALSGKAAAGTVVFAACGLPERELIVQSPLELPEDLVRGEDAWFATTWPENPGGDGVIVRVMQGRVKKLAGNPDHPVNMGKQTVRYDPAIQMLYHPDRVSQPLVRRSKGGVLSETSWQDIEPRFRNAVTGNRVTVVTNPLRGHLGWVASEFARIQGGRHITYDTMEQGVTHAAVKRVFDADTLPNFDIGNAHTVLSFGADWLSTWGSPARYAAEFGRFRGGDTRGFFIHAEPRMSMTAANADLWLAVRPGLEGDLALAIAQVIIAEGLASDAEVNQFRANMPGGSLDGYQPRDVATRSGVGEDRIRRAAQRFATSRPSLAFGGGSAGAHTNGSFNLTAIYALNSLVSSVGQEGGVILNPESALGRLTGSAHGASFQEWEEELAQWRAGNVDTVIIRGADIVYGLPNSVNVKDALSHVANVIYFGQFVDDTGGVSDMVLPEKTFFEDWGTDIPEPAPGYQVISFQQPVVGPTVNFDETGLVADARSFGDALLQIVGNELGATSMENLVRQASAELFGLGRASSSVKAPSEDLFMQGVLQRGGWWDTASTGAGSAQSTNPFDLPREAEFSDSAAGGGEEFNLVPFQSNSLLDGRLAPTPWAQQSPDPMSTATWVTWAEINKHDAERNGIREGDVLLIRSTSGEIQALAYSHPGVPEGVIGIPVGQGHEHGGRYAEDRGSNVLRILVDKKDAETGALAWAATRVKVQRSGTRTKLSKFEGNVEAFPAEPGVPVLVVAPGETAHEAEEANHHEYQKQFLGNDNESGSAEH